MSREYRALGRELRSGPQIKRRPVWARLVWWVLRHGRQHTWHSGDSATLISFGTPDHGVSAYLGRWRYRGVPPLAVASASEDLRNAGPVTEGHRAQL